MKRQPNTFANYVGTGLLLWLGSMKFLGESAVMTHGLRIPNAAVWIGGSAVVLLQYSGDPLRGDRSNLCWLLADISTWSPARATAGIDHVLPFFLVSNRLNKQMYCFCVVNSPRTLVGNVANQSPFRTPHPIDASISTDFPTTSRRCNPWKELFF